MAEKKMNKIYILLFLIFLTSCVKNVRENKVSISEKQRTEDIKTCEYYGFKKGTSDFSFCLMKLDNTRNEILLTKKMLECENVRRDNANMGAVGFWGGILKGLRENLSCD